MISPGNGFFLQLVNEESGERTLHPVVLTGQQGDVYMASTELESLSLEAGQNLLVFFESKREFMQQPARIEMILEDEPKLVFGFTTTADAISAESRQCYRVLTTFANLTIVLGSEECELTDVCPSGFSAVSNARHQVGDPVETQIIFQARQYVGQACVQSAKKLPSGQTRYGFRTMTTPGSTSTLEKGLQQITAEIQRQQLRRRAGA